MIRSAPCAQCGFENDADAEFGENCGAALARVCRVLVTSVLHWRNAAFDRLVEAASRVSDQDERIKLYQAADRILIEEAAVIPLLYNRNHALEKPWIRHDRLSPMRSWYWKDVVIEPH